MNCIKLRSSDCDNTKYAIDLSKVYIRGTIRTIRIDSLHEQLERIKGYLAMTPLGPLSFKPTSAKHTHEQDTLAREIVRSMGIDDLEFIYNNYVFYEIYSYSDISKPMFSSCDSVLRELCDDVFGLSDYRGFCPSVKDLA